MTGFRPSATTGGARVVVHWISYWKFVGPCHWSRKPSVRRCCVCDGRTGDARNSRWKSTSMVKLTAKLLVFCTPSQYVEPGTSGGGAGAEHEQNRSSRLDRRHWEATECRWHW